MVPKMASPMEVKQVSFPKKLLSRAEQRMAEIGVGFPEYIRYLVMRDTENIFEEEWLSEEDEASVGRALDDLKQGRYEVMKKEDIEGWISELVQKSK